MPADEFRYYWYKREPADRHGQPCKIVRCLERGFSGEYSRILVEFADGTQVRTARTSVRKKKAQAA